MWLLVLSIFCFKTQVLWLPLTFAVVTGYSARAVSFPTDACNRCFFFRQESTRAKKEENFYVASVVCGRPVRCSFALHRRLCCVIASGRNGFDQKNRLHITSEDAEKPCLPIVRKARLLQKRSRHSLLHQCFERSAAICTMSAGNVLQQPPIQRAPRLFQRPTKSSHLG